MKINVYIRIGLCIIATILLSESNANAELHGTLTGTTNYIWRMYSKSNGDPAIQANLDYQHKSGFYVGSSVSSFNPGPSEEVTSLWFSDQARAEITPYIGWSFEVNDDWRFDLQYSRYLYTGKFYEFSGDYNEIYLFLHYKDLLTMQASATDDFYGMGDKAFFYEITGRYPITDYLEMSALFGYAQTSPVTTADYPYWNGGLTARYRFLAFDLRYHDARELYQNDRLQSPNHPITIGATVVFSISAGF